MAKTTPRLHVAQKLGAVEIVLDRDQAHYLVHVLRLAQGDPVAVFNSIDGEWLAYLTSTSKKGATLRGERLLHDVVLPPDIDYIFAPIKHARLDYVVQKAVELGARRLRPVITARTMTERINLDRMRTNVIEACEQCNLVAVPEVLEPVKFVSLLREWHPGRTLIHCDETETPENPLISLAGLTLPAAVLIGPEGGFTPEERAGLKVLPHVRVISLGPRIMRADTAAIAALTLVQAIAGDWGRPENM
jgi:16S rRNA (uracil1498-N3)-methyltransferase